MRPFKVGGLYKVTKCTTEKTGGLWSKPWRFKVVGLGEKEVSLLWELDEEIHTYSIKDFVENDLTRNYKRLGRKEEREYRKELAVNAL